MKTAIKWTVASIIVVALAACSGEPKQVTAAADSTNASAPASPTQNSAPAGEAPAEAADSALPSSLTVDARSDGSMDPQLLGKWEQNLANCEVTTDSYIFIVADGISGYEWSCDVPNATRSVGGIEGDLSCYAEGEEYRQHYDIRLSQPPLSLSIKTDKGAARSYRKCPASTEDILP